MWIELADLGQSNEVFKIQDLIQFDYLGQKKLFRKYTRYTVIIRVDLGQTFFYKNASFFFKIGVGLSNFDISVVVKSII